MHRKDRHIVINGRMLRLCTIFALAIIVIGYLLTVPLGHGESNLIGWILLTVLISLFLSTYILFPHYCVINSTGIEIIYALGLKEFVEWENLYKIYLDFDSSQRHSIRTKYNYCFVGMKGKKFFFMSSEFPQTTRLETLLSYYSNKKSFKILKKNS